MSDYVKQKIEERLRRMADLQRQIDLLSAEVAAYQDAIGHSGSAAPKVNGSNGGSHVGDSHWPEMIKRLGKDGQKITIDDVERDFQQAGRTIKRKSIRAKMAVLAKKNRLRRIRDGVYKLGTEPWGEDSAA